MEQSDPRLQELVDLAFEAVVDPARWQVFLERLVALTGSDRAVLHRHWHDGGDSGGVLSIGMPAGAMQAHRAHFWQVEPWWEGRAPDRRNRPPVVYPHRHPAVPGSEYFHDWMQRWDIYDDACVTLESLDGTPRPGLSVGFADRKRQYAADDERLLKALLPHASRAVFLARAFQQQRVLGEHAGHDANAIGVVELSATRRILECNTTARRLLGLEREPGPSERPAAGECALLAHPRAPAELVFADRRTQLAFEAALVDVLAPGLTRVAPACFDVPRPRRAPLVAFVTRTPSSWFSDRALRLYVLDPRGVSTDGFVTWQTLWKLTRTECRVAAELLNGRTIKEVAAANQVSTDAVRFHVKNMLAKTATRRQAALLLLLGRAGGFTPR